MRSRLQTFAVTALLAFGLFLGVGHSADKPTSTLPTSPVFPSVLPLTRVPAGYDVLAVFDSYCVTSVTVTKATRVEAPLVNDLPDLAHARMFGLAGILRKGCYHIEVHKKP